ncbi:phospholipase D family protein [Massilia sp. S19_KUP03_FR1]|uniref:phospholipase D family protein n=1 Tax=Massilia sp. S19_KUP03_FR1 TaxID=3025503 RepID=UPI002FCD7E4A
MNAASHRKRRWISAVLILVLAAGGALEGCTALPKLGNRAVTSAAVDTDGTRLGKSVTAATAEHPGKAGLVSLSTGHSAFAARALLANAAERTLDVQYYMWHADTTGKLLFAALKRAADRGVRVRLLLDDNNTTGMDQLLLALDRLPNMEVRLFNPFAMRTLRPLGYLTDFSRLNRRMHNKSFTADNQITIVGGRNIGDEYFDAGSDVLFIDLDVIALGPVVREVSRDFDVYWNSKSAYPVDLLIKPDPEAHPLSALDTIASEPDAQVYLDEVKNTPFVEKLTDRSVKLEWAATQFVSDDPGKVLGQESEASKLAPQLLQLIGKPKKSVNLVSPYFVPGERGYALFAQLREQGTDVRILTNALESTDVAAVHAGYSKWRAPLLKTGVTLYELRAAPGAPSRKSIIGTGSGSGAGGSTGGSSGSSLHAKTFEVDGEKVFVGSYNVDQRSRELNTEMGLVVDSPTMARQLSDSFNRNMTERAYQVKLAPDGSLYWIGTEKGVVTRYDVEPGTTFLQRLGVKVLSWLPIDWLL